MGLSRQFEAIKLAAKSSEMIAKQNEAANTKILTKSNGYLAKPKMDTCAERIEQQSKYLKPKFSLKFFVGCFIISKSLLQ